MALSPFATGSQITTQWSCSYDSRNVNFLLFFTSSLNIIYNWHLSQKGQVKTYIGFLKISKDVFMVLTVVFLYITSI